ncbi:MAG: class I SAM-dependent methyltransferase [Brevefilum sp.]
MATQIKHGIQTRQKGMLIYQLDENDRPIRYQPWLGNAFAFLYDFFMVHSIFPNKFNASQERHKIILSEQLQNIHGQHVLELGTGSGSTTTFLPPDNAYVGTDVSTGLLKQAVKRFKQAGFGSPEFYVASGDDLPFADESFDLCLCILSLNFIGHHKKVFNEVHGLLRSGGNFIACVPVPERTPKEITIHGNLLSEVRLEKLCRQTGFIFEPIKAENGALLYFWANKPEKE